jgi:hypothetical protein
MRPAQAGKPVPPEDLFHTISQSIGGTGVSPVQAQAKACGYHELPFYCNSESELSPSRFLFRPNSARIYREYIPWGRI